MGQRRNTFKRSTENEVAEENYTVFEYDFTMEAGIEEFPNADSMDEDHHNQMNMPAWQY